MAGQPAESDVVRLFAELVRERADGEGPESLRSERRRPLYRAIRRAGFDVRHGPPSRRVEPTGGALPGMGDLLESADDPDPDPVRVFGRFVGAWKDGRFGDADKHQSALKTLGWYVRALTS
jgi:hypothetical protein